MLALSGTILAAERRIGACVRTRTSSGRRQATVSGNTLTVTASVADSANAGGRRLHARRACDGGLPLLHEEREQAAGCEQAGDDRGRTRPIRSRCATVGRTSPSPVSPLSTLECPKGQRVVVESVDFSGLTLCGEGVSHAFLTAVGVLR